jgi:hypothetical protein
MLQRSTALALLNLLDRGGLGLYINSHPLLEMLHIQARLSFVPLYGGCFFFPLLFLLSFLLFFFLLLFHLVFSGLTLFEPRFGEKAMLKLYFLAPPLNPLTALLPCGALYITCVALFLPILYSKM